MAPKFNSGTWIIVAASLLFLLGVILFAKGKMEPVSLGQTASGTLQKVSNKRSKFRTPGCMVKSETNKGDVMVLNIHTRVQEMFSHHLSQLLHDQLACDLQCCVTYGKPCGCIRKFIIAGQGWKDNTMPNLHIGQNSDINEDAIAASDRMAMQEEQVTRARELLQILHQASDLKKEKCYTVASEGIDGKPLKELRGMIGLGNGRKRSKKYEDFVLDKRSQLRNQYSLCEKAAQKLLGYSINFLYKKLRTNPQKTSRLVATNKAERASKVPRHLISLQQLREIATNPPGSSQCCCRNCISWLVKQHFDKIVDWRQRLEGSGQRVAQEIVAEVLLASASLDGQNSFCQNLVHWVTGCSFKKIRRVRDHLKKDPKTLPEHGLKKYWKNKASKGSSKSKSSSSSQVKMEKDSISYYGTHVVDRFPSGYDARSTSRTADNSIHDTQINNVNTNNNRFEAHFRQPGSSTQTNLLYQPLTEAAYESRLSYTNSNQEQRHDGVKLQQSYPIAGNNSNSLMSNLQQPGHGFRLSAPVLSHNNAVYSNTQTFSGIPATLQSQGFTEKNALSTGNQLQSRGSVIIQTRAAQRDQQTYHEESSNQHLPDNSYINSFRRDDQEKFYSAPFIASLPENTFGESGRPSYYLAASGNVNHTQDGIFHTGMTPLFLAQTQQPEIPQGEQEGVTTSSQFFLLSPALPNSQEKGGFDFENWKQMGMPLTPIQMYPASYFSQNNEGGEQKNLQTWSGEPQHFMFPMADSTIPIGQSMEVHSTYENSNPQLLSEQKRPQLGLPSNSSQQSYITPGLTPVAVMQPSHLFSNVGWIAASLDDPIHGSENNSESLLTKNDLEQREKHYLEPTNYATHSDDRYYEQSLRPQQFAILPEWPVSGNIVEQISSTSNSWISTPINMKNVTQPTQIINEPVVSTVISEPRTESTSLMPPLAPIQTTGKVNEITESLKESESQCEQVSSPKGASIGDRSKRFSRDRLRATIDSPCLPPMTPLTPSLSPSLPPGSCTSSTGDPEALSGSPQATSKLDNSVFRFPPAHISRRMAALRMQGVTLDKGNKLNPENDSVRRDDNISPSNLEEKDKEPKSSHKNLSGSLESASSLGYISESLLQGGLVDLTNVKALPVLSLPSAGWTDDTNIIVTVKESTGCQNQSNHQQLKTPTPVLDTPTQNITPSSHLGKSPTDQLHTPNQPLNTPNQALNTPNQLNTPTQPLNTPTPDCDSPNPADVITSIDEDSPVKELLPAPIGKKRKADTIVSGCEKAGKLRFHHFTPQDWEKDGFTPTAYIKTDSPVIMTDCDVGKGQRRSRKQPKPKPVNDQDLEHNPKTEDKNIHQAKSIESQKDSVVLVGKPLQLAHMKAPLLQRITPVFPVPVTSDSFSSTSQTQLNTPVFIHSAALMTPSSRISSSHVRKPSSAQGNISLTSTPQFFTFMPSAGFSTPTVFFAPTEQPKKVKLNDGCAMSTGVGEKRIPRALTISQSVKDDTLQTPSKIQVVTPSASLNSAGIVPTTEVAQMFSFSEQVIATQNNLTTAQVENQNLVSTENSGQPGLSKDTTSSQTESKKTIPTKGDTENGMAPPSVIPTFVVDPPSDGEEENREYNDIKCKLKATAQVESKQTLHRVRSGGKTDLVISVKAQSNESGASKSSPLDTPSTIQVITPTISSESVQVESPTKRLSQALCVHPQPLVVTPICLNAVSTQSGSSGIQVQTPTFFHIISPSQPTPSSPPVLVYPYPGRSYGAVSGPRTASPVSTVSPAFGILQRGNSAAGSNSGSLLKSALMKKFPVFQFPPPSAIPYSSESDKTEDCVTPKTPHNGPPGVLSDSTDATTKSPSVNIKSAAAVSVICRPHSSTQLADKLSGVNDPCLSEAAEKDP